jgi:hypothetical protein
MRKAGKNLLFMAKEGLNITNEVNFIVFCSLPLFQSPFP